MTITDDMIERAMRAWKAVALGREPWAPEDAMRAVLTAALSAQPQRAPLLLEDETDRPAVGRAAHWVSNEKGRAMTPTRHQDDIATLRDELRARIAASRCTQVRHPDERWQCNRCTEVCHSMPPIWELWDRLAAAEASKAHNARGNAPDTARTE